MRTTKTAVVGAMSVIITDLTTTIAFQAAVLPNATNPGSPNVVSPVLSLSPVGGSGTGLLLSQAAATALIPILQGFTTNGYLS
jgi:hypothetical protein